MQRCIEPQRNQVPQGIRAGVWLVALALVVGCALFIAVFAHHTSSSTVRAASSSESALAGQPSIASKVYSWRRSRPPAGGTLEQSGGWPTGEWSAEQAATLACSLANQSARELYDCEPFGNGPAARLVDGRWVWSERRGHGRADIEATVQFALDGSVENVDVLLLDFSTRDF